jgi:hypothetical protein
MDSSGPQPEAHSNQPQVKALSNAALSLLSSYGFPADETLPRAEGGGVDVPADELESPTCADADDDNDDDDNDDDDNDDDDDDEGQIHNTMHVPSTGDGNESAESDTSPMNDLDTNISPDCDELKVGEAATVAEPAKPQVPADSYVDSGTNSRSSAALECDDGEPISAASDDIVDVECDIEGDDADNAEIEIGSFATPPRDSEHTEAYHEAAADVATATNQDMLAETYSTVGDDMDASPVLAIMECGDNEPQGVAGVQLNANPTGDSPELLSSEATVEGDPLHSQGRTEGGDTSNTSDVGADHENSGETAEPYSRYEQDDSTLLAGMDPSEELLEVIDTSTTLRQRVADRLQAHREKLQEQLRESTQCEDTDEAVEAMVSE